MTPLVAPTGSSVHSVCFWNIVKYSCWTLLVQQRLVVRQQYFIAQYVYEHVTKSLNGIEVLCSSTKKKREVGEGLL